MTATDPHRDPAVSTRVVTIKIRVGGRRAGRRVELAKNIIAKTDLYGVSFVDAEKILGVKLEAWQLSFLDRWMMQGRTTAEAFGKAGLVPEPPSDDPRQRALAAKAARGKGPPSPTGWRGRERNIKYKSR